MLLSQKNEKKTSDEAQHVTCRGKASGYLCPWIMNMCSNNTHNTLGGSRQLVTNVLSNIKNIHL